MPTVRSHDGLDIAYSHRRGDGPSLVFVHATGFCKEMWLPVLADTPFDRVLMDQRGHGLSEVGPPPFDWADLGRDVLAVVDAVTAPSRIGVGHSSGAAALLQAEAVRPGTFDGLVLVEPIVMPPPRVRLDEDPLVVGALRRRRSFESRDDAYDSFHGRGPFVDWEDQMLEVYVEHAFHEVDGRWALRCTPETEAEFYATARLHDTWERLGEVKCPAVVLGGEETTAPVGDVLEEMAARLGHGTLRIVPETGHFLPMERPETVAGTIADLMETGPGL